MFLLRLGGDDLDLRRRHHLGLKEDRVAEVHHHRRVVHRLHDQLRRVRLVT